MALVEGQLFVAMQKSPLASEKSHVSFVVSWRGLRPPRYHQIIDILPSRHFVNVAGFLDKQPAAWKQRIAFGALDMSAIYAAVYSVILPNAAQVVDASHVITMANRALDTVRRRVQNEQTGHRGRRHDPFYRARRALLAGEERLDQAAAARLGLLLELGDPHGEVAITYRVKERLREFYGNNDPTPPGRSSPKSSNTADARRCCPNFASSAPPSSAGSTRSATTTWPG